MEADWYLDPFDHDLLRYHDGDDWTDHVSRDGVAAVVPFPPEDERPLVFRRTCPVCARADVVLVNNPDLAFICLDCGVKLFITNLANFADPTILAYHRKLDGELRAGFTPRRRQ